MLHSQKIFSTDLPFVITMNIKQGVLKFQFFFIHAGHACLGCLCRAMFTVLRERARFSFSNGVAVDLTKAAGDVRACQEKILTAILWHAVTSD